MLQSAHSRVVQLSTDKTNHAMTKAGSSWTLKSIMDEIKALKPKKSKMQKAVLGVAYTTLFVLMAGLVVAFFTNFFLVFGSLFFLLFLMVMGLSEDDKTFRAWAQTKSKEQLITLALNQESKWLAGAAKYYLNEQDAHWEKELPQKKVNRNMPKPVVPTLSFKQKWSWKLLSVLGASGLSVISGLLWNWHSLDVAHQNNMIAMMLYFGGICLSMATAIYVLVVKPEKTMEDWADRVVKDHPDHAIEWQSWDHCLDKEVREKLRVALNKALPNWSMNNQYYQ